MKKSLALFCLLGALAGSLSASPDSGGMSVSQEIIPLTAMVYQDMDTLYLLSGQGTPSNSRPWNKSEAMLILSRIDRSMLSGTLAKLHDSISTAIQPGLRFQWPGGFGFGLALDTAFETYAHANTEFDREEDWIRGFEQRQPMVRLSLAITLKDFSYIHCDLQYQRNRFNYLDEYYPALEVHPLGIGAVIGPDDTQALLVGHSAIFSQPFLTNILDHSYNFDYQWPKRAVAAIGGADWSFSLSRDRLSWGNGRSGNFIVDNHVDYHDFARLVTFLEPFKYDWLTIFFDTNTLWGEQPDTKFKMLMAHRLEFRMFDRLTFAISENIMYQNAVFDIRYLNPAFIYHNLNNLSMFNAIAHAELDWNITAGLSVYAQGVMDQAVAPNESAAQSSALGWLAGIEYATVVGKGILGASLELASTDPVLYRRERIDFIMIRKYYTNGNPGPGNILSLDYIGYQYGGDAQVIQADCNWRVPGTGSINLRLFGMRHGEMDFYMSHNLGNNNAHYANYDGQTPSGNTVRESIVASLSGECLLPGPLSWMALRLWAELDWIGRRTLVKANGSYREVGSDLQFTLGCSLSM